jgi:hypothetical protein
MSKRIGPITLDGDTADRITVLTLKEQRSYLKKELSSGRKIPAQMPILTDTGCILRMSAETKS